MVQGSQQFSLDRAQAINEQFQQRLKAKELPTVSSVHLGDISAEQLLSWFDSQCKSRLLDIIARRLKERGESFYTIGSSGHEGNAVLGDVFGCKDMALLHYRSGAFFIERAKKDKHIDGVLEVMRSLVASLNDGISSGRHKVIGSLLLNIPPQTSTIASHLPKALGAAMSITRRKELKIPGTLNDDSVILCSFGDASLNHAASQATFNACSWLRRSSYPVPLIFICEDNGIGISVKTPKDWVKETMANRAGLHYIEANGLDVVDVYHKAIEAEYIARIKKQPVFFHLKCVRLLGHAGSDIETQYQSEDEVLRREAQDPLLYTAAYLIEQRILTYQQILAYYERLEKEITDIAERCIKEPKLASKEAVMASIIPEKKLSPMPRLDDKKRQQLFGSKYSQLALKRTLQQQINFALTDILAQYPQTLLFGEDVGKKGGVYRVTADLQKTFGIRRVFDTLLDETTILGTAIGLAHNGFIPIPEIQFLAYIHNAIDQLRGEAATLSFFSNGQYQNPMVIRVASLAYQKGFGGHFHNDNAIAFLREIPGVIIACPSRGDRAAMMLRECVRLAYEERRVCVFLEPIALYMTKDLVKPKDDGWLSVYPDIDRRIPFGEVYSEGEGDTVILSYGNGFYLSSQAKNRLKEAHGIDCKIVDIGWLSPLPMEALIKAIGRVKKVLIVDECRKTGSLSEELVTRLVCEYKLTSEIKRITGEDSFIPTGRSWSYVLPSCDDIVDSVLNWNK